ncbi:MAG: leucine-rich repeat domain-containing protein [Bacteroidales bacterium]|nr:leucine-rich repeat domain-containing protein [Bacteroidales bacterium]
MKRLVLSSALMVFVAVLCNNAFAYDFSAVCESGQTLYYNITSDTEPYTVEVTRKNLATQTGNLIIPESVSYNGIEYSVTSIGNWAFVQCTELISVIIPNSVTNIDGSAFRDCYSLTSVNVTDYVTNISGYAFYGCRSLSSLTIPNSVTSIGYYAFFNVRNVVYNGTATGSPWGALTINGYIDGHLVYSDDTKTDLTGCSIFATEVTIPNSVTNIGDYAFAECKELASITIPNSVIYIGKYAFSNCESLIMVNIPNSVGYIGDCAFEQCKALTSISIPNLITRIERGAFMYCKGLTSVTIPNSVTSIGNGAFEYCSGLTSVIIPNSVTSIEEYAFGQVRNIEYNGTATGSPWGAFTVNGFIDGYLVYSDETKTNLTGCSALAIEAVIPNSVINIGSSAFFECENLLSISIGNSVERIGDYAFCGCRSLTGELITPNSLINIGREAFINCDGISSITLGNSITSIGAGAFYACNSLDTIISLASTPPAIELLTFQGVPQDIPVIVPCGSVSAYRNAEYWSDFTNIQSECNYTLSAFSSDSNFGTASGGGTYLEGTVATIEATAYDGYAFLEWNDGNTENPRTIEVISDTTFIATFAIARTVTIESSNTDMGYVIGSGVYAEGAEVEITAVPYEGNRFDHWVDVDNPSRDFNTDNPRTIVVSGDITYIAVFESEDAIEDYNATEIALFPNPTTDILNITSSETISEIEFVNVMGQVVKRMEVNADNAVCDVEDLKAGVYVVRIHAGGTVVSQRKFVKK